MIYMNTSSRIIQDLIAEIIGYIGALYKASEAVCDPESVIEDHFLPSIKVALVDMLWSFAHASISMITLICYPPLSFSFFCVP